MTATIGCDAALAARAGPSGGPRRDDAVIAASILGSSLAMLDGSVVNVALPTIGRELAATPAALSWTVNAYLLPLGALILLGGATGDHYGRRRLFEIGVALFLAASIGCAAAPSFTVLLAARGLQGVGAALLMPNSLAMLGAAFDGEARGRAIGTWAAAGAITGAVAPLLGGWIIDMSGWRPIFLLNLPLGLAAMALAWRYGQESRERRAGARLDWPGGLIVTLSLGLLVWTLTRAAEPDPPALLWLFGAVGLALIGLFLFVEHRAADDALMPFALFGTRAFAGLSLLTFFLYAALGGLLVLLPFVLIRLGGYSAAGAGAAMMPIAILIGLASRPMGRIAARIGSRLPLAGGAALVAIGLALYARIGVGTVGYVRDVLPATLLVAFGMAICVAPLTTAVMASVDADHVGSASGFNSALARIGGLIATALAGFVFAAAGTPEGIAAGTRIAAFAGAGAAAFAAVCAFALLPGEATRRIENGAAGED